MDIMWALRSAYGEARNLMQSQDAYCAKAEAGLWGSVNGGFPENQKWELLVDVLRGKVKVRYNLKRMLGLVLEMLIGFKSLSRSRGFRCNDPGAPFLLDCALRGNSLNNCSS